MKTLFLILLLTTAAFTQDYGPNASNTDSAVKMHFAITLLRGNLTTAQEDFLRKAIVNRRSISQEEAARLFTRTELRDIFFAIGREDISTFKSMYEKGRIAEKRAVWQTLTPEQRVEARRINFAWVIGYSGLTEVQMEFLLRFSKALPKITREEGDLFEAEAVGLFSKDVGRLLFSSIGPYTDKPCEKTVTAELQTNCPCSIGSSFNMACDAGCISSSTCTRTGDGCGFAWLYACDGKCSGT